MSDCSRLAPLRNDISLSIWRQTLSFCQNNELSALDQLSDRKPRVYIQLESKSKFTTWNGVWCEMWEEIGFSNVHSSILCWLVNQIVHFWKLTAPRGEAAPFTCFRNFHAPINVCSKRRQMQNYSNGKSNSNNATSLHRTAHFTFQSCLKRRPSQPFKAKTIDA